jgi:hypothetical protein
MQKYLRIRMECWEKSGNTSSETDVPSLNKEGTRPGAFAPDEGWLGG